MKKVITPVLACGAVTLAVAAVLVFNLSADFARGAKDPDLAEMRWDVIGFRLLLISGLLGLSAFAAWLLQEP